LEAGKYYLKLEILSRVCSTMIMTAFSVVSAQAILVVDRTLRHFPPQAAMVEEAELL
jgi:hypothetical protein